MEQKGGGLMAGGAAKPAAAARNPMGTPDDATPNVAPEEQQAYDEFVGNATDIIWNEKVMPDLLKRVAVSPSPAEGLAGAAVAVVMRVEDSARKAGVEIPGDVKFHGGMEILEHIVELAEEAGIHEFTPDEIEQAALMAADSYREARQADGTLPVDEISDDMAAVVQADQQGTLDELVPGAGEYAQMAARRQGGGQAEGGKRRGLMG